MVLGECNSLERSSTLARHSGFIVATLTKSETYPDATSAGMHVEIFRSVNGIAWDSWKVLCGSETDPVTGLPVQLINGNIPASDPYCFQYGSALGSGNWSGYHAALTWYMTNGSGTGQPVTLAGASFDPAQLINYGTASTASVGVGVPWIEGSSGSPPFTGFESPWGFHNGVTSPSPNHFNVVWTDWRATDGSGSAVPNVSSTTFGP